MSLHNGIDTISILSYGVYSETYGQGEEGNLANLFSTLGLFEDAPTEALGAKVGGLMKLGMSTKSN